VIKFRDTILTLSPAGLPSDLVVPIPRTPQKDSTLPMEEGEIEQEIVSALDEEARERERDEEKDRLSGTYVPFQRAWTGRNTGISDEDIKKLLKRHKLDLHGVPLVKRGDTYRYLLKGLGEKMRKKLKSKLAEYNEAVNWQRLIKVMHLPIFGSFIY